MFKIDNMHIFCYTILKNSQCLVEVSISISIL